MSLWNTILPGVCCIAWLTVTIVAWIHEASNIFYRIKQVFVQTKWKLNSGKMHRYYMFRINNVFWKCKFYFVFGKQIFKSMVRILLKTAKFIKFQRKFSASFSTEKKNHIHKKCYKIKNWYKMWWWSHFWGNIRWNLI